MNSIFSLLFYSLSSKLVTNSWNLHNRRLLKTRALVIEMEEDAISHALGLNYGIISECIIEYLPLRNHYHMLCINSGCGVSSGLMHGNANRMTFIHVVQHCTKNVPCWATGWGKNEYVFTLELYLHWTRKTMSQSTKRGRWITQLKLFCLYATVWGRQTWDGSRWLWSIVLAFIWEAKSCHWDKAKLVALMLLQHSSFTASICLLDVHLSVCYKKVGLSVMECLRVNETIDV